jgi:hypothetical protein
MVGCQNPLPAAIDTRSMSSIGGITGASAGI